MPIAIVGSGRSGTSMVARLLNLCGVYMGAEEDMYPAAEYNTKGCWEFCPIQDLNTCLLNHFDGSLQCPPYLPTGWENDPALTPHYETAKEIIAQQFKGHEVWGWKDPRTTFLIPFWKRVVPDLKFVICLRNPLDFSASAARVGWFKTQNELTLTFWQAANLQILTDTAGDPRILVNYEDFFPAYSNALFPVLDFLGIPKPEKGSDIDIACHDFCEVKLAHFNSTVTDVWESNEATAELKGLYSDLRLGCFDGEAAEQVAAGDTYRRTLYNKLISILMGQELRARCIEAANDCEHMEQVLGSRTHQLAEALKKLDARKMLQALLRRQIAY